MAPHTVAPNGDSDYTTTTYLHPSLPDRSVVARPSIHQKEKDLPGGRRWVVQKFGGTSVGKFARGICENIVATSAEHNRIAVVCSARSTHTKGEGTTNRLLRAAREAEHSGSRAYVPIIEAVRLDHINAARVSILSDSLVDTLTAEINAECDSLIKILESAQHLEEVSARAEDKIISKGEILSCRFMTALLRDIGVNAVFIDLSNVLKPLANGGGPFEQPRLDEDFYARVGNMLAQSVSKASADQYEQTIPGDIVPVLTGYFGPVPGGLLSSVGRGYTDLCAALLAVGLASKELQIWKEVDGIFTADPRKVPTARLLDSVTPGEAAELTYYGSEVIHPFTMEQVIRARIPIRIKNVMNPRGTGTVILPDPVSPAADEGLTAASERKLFRTRSASYISYGPARANGVAGYGRSGGGAASRAKRPTAVTVKHNIIILNVHSNKRTRAHGFLANIFNILDRHHFSVDLISSSEVHVSCTLHSADPLLAEPNDRPFSPTPAIPGTPTTGMQQQARSGTATPRGGGGDEELSIANAALNSAVAELAELGTIDIVPNCAIVSLVGSQLRNMVGISGRFLSTLGREGINIEMISQGASEINISAVVEEREADHALSAVHTSLFTFLEDY